jgi:hypothetical protein
MVDKFDKTERAERAAHYHARLNAHGHNPAAARAIADEMIEDPVISAKDAKTICRSFSGRAAADKEGCCDMIAQGRGSVYGGAEIVPNGSAIRGMASYNPEVPEPSTSSINDLHPAQRFVLATSGRV